MRSKNAEFFLFVLSPDSLLSDNCRWEYEQAKERKAKDRIGIALCCDTCGSTDFGKELLAYQAAIFEEDFEVGFRGLTQMMMGQPYSSWEYLSSGYSKDYQYKLLYQALQKGFIPGLIAKSLGEWIIVEKLWKCLETYMISLDKTSLKTYRGSPRTALGILIETSPILEQFEKNGDAIGINLIEKSQPIIEMFVKNVSSSRDNSHQAIGLGVSQVIQSVKLVLENNAIAFRDANDLWHVRHKYEFDIAEKLRELINMHARRSRYLY